MLALQKAYAADFERVYELLLEFENPYLCKDDWKNLFINHWRSPFDHFGYILVDEKENVVGFLGTIFSKRYINNAAYLFCNLTSWIVKDEYRGSGLRLLLQALTLKSCIFTNLSPSPTVRDILMKLKFVELESYTRIVLAVPSVNLFRRVAPVSITLDESRIEHALSGDESAIFRDHVNFNCIHVLLVSDVGRCYCVVTKVVRFMLPFAVVHFVGDPKIFGEIFESVRFKLAIMLRVVGFWIDERFFKGEQTSYAFKRPHTRLSYKSSLSNENIDNLYSELILLKNEKRRS